MQHKHDGKDADAEFDALYTQEPDAIGEASDNILPAPPEASGSTLIIDNVAQAELHSKLILAVGVAALLLIALIGLRLTRRPTVPT